MWNRYRVRRHRRYRRDGSVERVRGYRRRPYKLRWRIVYDDLFSGLAVLVQSSGGTVMRILMLIFAVVAVLGYLIAAPIAWLTGHPIGPKRKHVGLRKNLCRGARRYTRAKIKTIKRTLGTERRGWSAEQRRIARGRNRHAGRR